MLLPPTRHRELPGAAKPPQSRPAWQRHLITTAAVLAIMAAGHDGQKAYAEAAEYPSAFDDLTGGQTPPLYIPQPETDQAIIIDMADSPLDPTADPWCQRYGLVRHNKVRFITACDLWVGP